MGLYVSGWAEEAVRGERRVPSIWKKQRVWEKTEKVRGIPRLFRFIVVG